MHYYKLDGGPNGYAGFNSGIRHRLLFSLWENNGVHPEIEYVSPWADLNDLLFSGEGTGKHIKTEFNWEVGAWYTMCINATTRCGKTFYSQWIRKQGDSNWLLCGILSFPAVNKMFKSSSLFMEDVQKNNLERKCSVTNYLARRVSNATWKSLNQYVVSNRYYLPDGSGSLANQSLDCQYGYVASAPPHMWIRSGGEPESSHVSHGQELPHTELIAQESIPTIIPTNAPLVPRFIQSTYGNSDSYRYIAPNDSNQVFLDSVVYHWVFEDSNDGYFYILTSDKTKAITVGSDGVTVYMSTFSYSNSQKWTKKSYVCSKDIYISPRNYPLKSLGITGLSTEPGALITLKNYHESASDLKFYAQNTGTFKNIKNVNSSKYIAPSGSKLIQRGLAYRWIFIPVDNEYYYIVTQDCLNAITISTAEEGVDLSFASFVVGNTMQMWKIIDAGNNNYYLVPKEDPSLGMTIMNRSTSTNAYVQVETMNTSVSAFRWILANV